MIFFPQRYDSISDIDKKGLHKARKTSGYYELKLIIDIPKRRTKSN